MTSGVDLMDNEYLSLTEKILSNRKFKKLKEVDHHYTSNRYDHSVEVSYLSYKLCKKLGLDYKSAARAGLVHDFFFNEDIPNKGKRLVTHYKKSIENASKIINLTDKERNIISSHMFPVGGTLPRSRESIIVDVVDDYVSIKERLSGDLKSIESAAIFILVVIANFLR